MKKVILLALLMPYPAFGQIVDNFESQNTANWVQSSEGHWKADTVAHLSGMFSLHHVYDNPDAGIDQIGINIGKLHPEEGATRWSFLVRYGYDPSSLNNWSVFLLSDVGPPGMLADGSANGYAVGVNFSGSDDTLRLWKIKGTQITTVVNSRINWQTQIGAAKTMKILVERTINGLWTLSISEKNGNLIGSAKGTDKELSGTSWFGVYYKYSSTRDRLLWLDDIDIEGIFREDTTAPVLTGCETSGRNSIIIRLNEVPESGLMSVQNISLINGDKALTVLKLSDLSYLVVFADEFLNRSQNTLVINKLCDMSGNCSSNIKYDFTPAWAQTGDVIISEIMADPTPEVSLPGKEYIEITNRTDFPYNLKDWKLSTESQSVIFPQISMPASGIFIVCSSGDTSLFRKYGKVIGLKSFPSLTDAGRLLYLSDSTGTLIHGVEYSSKWYNDELKSGGGWSLEMIDKAFPFYDSDNWTASVSKNGGTPGIVNSVAGNNPDLHFLGIENVFAEDSSDIRITFSEPVFDLNPNDCTISDEKISAVHCIDSLRREWLIKPAHPLKRSEIYNFRVQNASDFAGNSIEKSEFRFGLTEMSEPGDFVFNELLFNPFPGDEDYLELFNNSKKILNASRLLLVSVSETTGTISDPVQMFSHDRCILPGEYFAITSARERIIQRYFSADKDNLFEISSMPSMPDDKGHLILYNRELDKIDEVFYDDNMQYSLLSSSEGVSLEKTNPVLESNLKANWKSASETSGWGTPGAPNSAYTELPVETDQVVFSSTKISPDNDGNEDFLTITLNLQGTGNVVSVTIFDEAGNYVRKLASNLFVGASSTLSWDGTGADGSMLDTGIYIILITTYNDSGNTGKWKKICTVIRQK
jgi:hypothetical protein